MREVDDEGTSSVGAMGYERRCTRLWPGSATYAPDVVVRARDVETGTDSMYLGLLRVRHPVRAESLRYPSNTRFPR